MSASQIGIMGGGFFLFYSAGQLLNGFLGDIFPPKLMVMSGLFLTAASNLGIGFLPDSRIIILLWGINGFAQSMLWGPLLRTLAAYFPPRRKSFLASILVSSVAPEVSWAYFLLQPRYISEPSGMPFYGPDFWPCWYFLSCCPYFPPPAPFLPAGRKIPAFLFSHRTSYCCWPRLCAMVSLRTISIFGPHPISWKPSMSIW